MLACVAETGISKSGNKCKEIKIRSSEFAKEWFKIEICVSVRFVSWNLVKTRKLPQFKVSPFA